MEEVKEAAEEVEDKTMDDRTEEVFSRGFNLGCRVAIALVGQRLGENAMRKVDRALKDALKKAEQEWLEGTP
jgi:hypothetical protein